MMDFTELSQPEELKSKRTLNAEHFLIGYQENGTPVFRMNTHIGHIHYKDKTTGEFEKIDPKLVATANGWEMRKSGYELEAPKRADGLIKFINSSIVDPRTSEDWEVGEEAIGFKALGVSNVEGKAVGDDKILYKNAYGDNIDLEITTQGQGFLKEVVINEKPKDLTKDLEFSFELDLGDLDIKTKKQDLASLYPRKKSEIQTLELSRKTFEAEGKISQARQEQKKIIKAIEKWECNLERESWDKKDPIETSDNVILEGNRRTWFKPFILKDAEGHLGLVKVRFEEKDGKIILTKVLDKRFLETANYPVRTDSSATYYAGAGDGHVNNRGGETDWDTVHNATDGYQASYTAANFRVGTPIISTYYYISRGFLPFDTSGLPDGAVISAAELGVYVESVSGSINYGIVQTTQVSNTQLEVADYDQCGATHSATEGATRQLFGGGGEWEYFNLNTTGKGWISKTGYTKLGIRCQYDLDDSANWNYSVYITANEGGANKAYLQITYTEVVLPTCTTQAVSSIAKTTATGNGNITATGGEDNDKRGFVYGTTSKSDPGNVAPGSSGYDTYVEDTGTYGTGAFDKTLITLTKGLLYYVRAYSHNSIGYDYGDEVSFTAKTDYKIEKSLKYDIYLGETGIQKSLKYCIVKEITPITKSLKYTIVKKATAKTKSLRYAIGKEMTPLTKSLKYCVVAEHTPIQKTLKYVVFSGVAIQKGLVYAVITTPTEKTKSLKYDIFLGATTLQKGLIYCVKAEVPINKSLKYTTISTPSAKTKSLKYTIIKTPSAKTKSLAYSIFLGATDIQKSLAYSICKAITIQKTLVYKALPAIAINKTLKYTIPTTPSAKTKSLQYCINLGSTNLQKGLIYAVIKGISKAKSLVYAVITKPKATKSLKYAVLTTPTVKTESLAYHIYLGIVKLQKSLKYTVVKGIPITKSLVYMAIPSVAITKSLKYTIPTTPTAKTKSLKYCINLGATKLTKSLVYSVITISSKTKGLSYNVNPGIKIEKSLKYTVVATSAKKEKSLKYTILTIPSAIQKSLKYTIPTNTKIQKSLSYLALLPVSITKVLKYVVITTPTEKTKSLRYDIFLGAVKLAKGLIYKVLPSIKQQKSLIYDVIGLVKIEKDLKYTILTIPTAKTKSLRYDIFLGLVKIQKSLIYDVLTSTKIEKSLTYMALPSVAINKTLKYTTISTPTAKTKSLKYCINLGVVKIEKSLAYYVKTIIGKTKGLIYDILTNTKIEKSLQYATRPNTSIPKTLKYTVITTPTKKTKSLRYDIYLGEFGIQKSLKYCILVPVSKTKDLRYDIYLGEKGIQKTLIYDTLTKPKITKGLIYDIKSFIKVQKTLKYVVETTPTGITKSLGYCIFLGITKIQKSLQYAVITTVKITKGLVYMALPVIAINKTLKYTILTTPTAIQKGLTYEVGTTPSALTKALEYCVITYSTITKSLRYAVLPTTKIQKSLEYTIKSPVKKTKDLTYTIYTIPTAIQKALKYTILTTPTKITKGLIYSVITIPTGITKSLKYTVILAIKKQKGLIYDILTSTKIQKSLIYDVISSPSAIEKSLKYTIIAEAPAITKSLKYCIITTPAEKTKSLEYQIITQTAIEKELHYEVISEQAITKSLKYCVITTPTAETKSLEYQILTITGIQKSLQYAVKAEVAITKSLKYCIINQPGTTITKTLKWEMMSYPYYPFPKGTWHPV